jgi:hypothetical protein
MGDEENKTPAEEAPPEPSKTPALVMAPPFETTDEDGTKRTVQYVELRSSNPAHGGCINLLVGDWEAFGKPESIEAFQSPECVAKRKEIAEERAAAAAAAEASPAPAAPEKPTS